MHTGRIIAYAAIGGVSAFGAFMLYKHLKNRGPAIDEAMADKLPPSTSPRVKDLQDIRPIAESNPVSKFRSYSRDAVSLTSGVRGAVPRFAMRDDGHETGTQILSYIPSMSLGGDRVATGSGVATVDTANEIRARSTRQSINPDTVRV